MFILLLLLGVANGAPILLERTFRERLAWPVGCGAKFFDGRPLFGPTKTWRGVAGAIAATALASEFLGLSWELGVWIGGGAMLGDLCSSFIKRRLGIPPSDMALGLDQVPESLFPLLIVRQELNLTIGEILSLTTLFFVLELLLSRLLFRLNLRTRPY